MKEKLSLKNLILLLALPIISILGLVFNFSEINAIDDKTNGIDFTYLNEIVASTIPFSHNVKQAGISIRYYTGETLQNDIFTSPNGLVKNFKLAEDGEMRNKNTQAILTFSEAVSSDTTSVYATIVPSASGVLKDNLPAFATTLNQKTLIENTYNQFAGEVSTINTFNTLSENNDKYIYFRTEDSISPLGAYYLYSELISRMLLAGDVLPINSYGVSYSSNEFYGDLYHEVPFKNLVGDVFSYYEYDNSAYREIHNISSSQITAYDSLYLKNVATLDSYRYGAKGIINVLNPANPPFKLLIIGDNCAVFLLPFISNHYSKVTYANINNLDDLSNFVGIESYDQILICVDINSYMNSDTLSSVLKGLI